MLGKWNDAHCGEKKGFICEAVLGPHHPTTPAPLITGYCPAGFRAHRNMCYRVFNVKKNWSDAQKACRALGRKYNLASISDILENGENKKQKHYRVNPSHVVTSIKQSTVLKGHFFMVLS
jgi:hypothetical protein